MWWAIKHVSDGFVPGTREDFNNWRKLIPTWKRPPRLFSHSRYAKQCLSAIARRDVRLASELTIVPVNIEEA